MGLGGDPGLPAALNDLAMGFASSSTPTNVDVSRILGSSTQSTPQRRPDRMPVCRHYLRQKCNYGQACRFSHDPVAVAQALQQDGMQNLNPSLSMPSMAPSVPVQDNTPGQRLLVSGLPPDWGAIDLGNYFEQFGEVADCDLTGSGRGFVRLTYARDADKAMAIIPSSPPINGVFKLIVTPENPPSSEPSSSGAVKREGDPLASEAKRAAVGGGAGTSSGGGAGLAPDQLVNLMRVLQEQSRVEAERKKQQEALLQQAALSTQLQLMRDQLLQQLLVAQAAQQQKSTKPHTFLVMMAPSQEVLPLSVELEAYQVTSDKVQAVNKAFDSGPVTLIFTARGSGHYAGYAEMAGRAVPRDEAKKGHEYPADWEYVCPVTWQKVGCVPWEAVRAAPPTPTHGDQLPSSVGLEITRRIAASAGRPSTPTKHEDGKPKKEPEIDVTSMNYEDYLKIIKTAKS